MSPNLIYFLELTVSSTILLVARILREELPISETVPVTFSPLTYAVLSFTISSAVAVASLVSRPPEQTWVPVTFNPAEEVKVFPSATSAASRRRSMRRENKGCQCFRHRVRHAATDASVLPQNGVPFDRVERHSPTHAAILSCVGGHDGGRSA